MLSFFTDIEVKYDTVFVPCKFFQASLVFAKRANMKNIVLKNTLAYFDAAGVAKKFFIEFPPEVIQFLQQSLALLQSVDRGLEHLLLPGMEVRQMIFRILFVVGLGADQLQIVGFVQKILRLKT